MKFTAEKRNSILSVTLIVLISRLVAFLKEFVLSYFFGVSAVSDAYGVAYTIPVTVMSLVAVGINTSYIPVFNKASSETDEKRAMHFSNHVMTVVLWFSLVIFLVIEIFTGQIVRIFAGGFSDSTAELTIRLTRYMAFAVFLIGYIDIMAAYVQLKSRYYVVPASDLILYMLTIVGILLAAWFRLDFLAVGVLVGYVLKALLLTVTALRRNYEFHPVLLPNDGYLKDFLVLILPVLLGSVASDINKIVDKTLASYIMEGGISVLHYAHKIDEAIISIFVTSVVAVAYPKISKAVNERDFDLVSERVEKDFCYIMFLLLPIVTGIALYSREIVTLLFVRGKFTHDDAVIVANTLLFYAGGMIATSLRKYIVRIYYSFHDSKLPASNAIGVIATNVAFSIVLSRFFGIYGIVLGTLVSVWAGLFHLLWKLKKHIRLNLKPVVAPLAKLLLCSAIMGAVSKGVHIAVGGFLHGNVRFLVAFAVAVVTYFVCAKLFRLDSLIHHIHFGKGRSHD